MTTKRQRPGGQIIGGYHTEINAKYTSEEKMSMPMPIPFISLRTFKFFWSSSSHKMTFKTRAIFSSPFFSHNNRYFWNVLIGFDNRYPQKIIQGSVGRPGMALVVMNSSLEFQGRIVFIFVTIQTRCQCQMTHVWHV